MLFGWSDGDDALAESLSLHLSHSTHNARAVNLFFRSGHAGYDDRGGGGGYGGGGGRGGGVSFISVEAICFGTLNLRRFLTTLPRPLFLIILFPQYGGGGKFRTQ